MRSAMPPAAGAGPAFAGVKALAEAALSGAPWTQVLLLHEAKPDFPRHRAARPRGDRQDSLHRQLWRLYRRDQRLRRPDPAGPCAAGVVAGWLSRSRGRCRPWRALRRRRWLPLHNTRAMPDVLLGLAHQMGGDLAKALPETTYDAMLKAAFLPLRARGGSDKKKTDDDFWDGGAGAGRMVGPPREREQSASSRKRPSTRLWPRLRRRSLPAAPGDFPFYFLPYMSQALGDGSLREPAVAAGDAGCADDGDVVKLGGDTSQDRGAPGHQARRPGRNRIAAGKRACSRHPFARNRARHGGHAASGKGTKISAALPAAVVQTRSRFLLPVAEHETGSLAWAATRVKLVARRAVQEQAKLDVVRGRNERLPARRATTLTTSRNLSLEMFFDRGAEGR